MSGAAKIAGPRRPSRAPRTTRVRATIAPPCRQVRGPRALVHMAASVAVDARRPYRKIIDPHLTRGGICRVVLVPDTLYRERLHLRVWHFGYLRAAHVERDRARAGRAIRGNLPFE